uniref:Uncharacterized protein n=1 Tax=Arundo donax TaxID=35708 RepID=A0A0A8ZW00_ARUDO
MIQLNPCHSCYHLVPQVIPCQSSCPPHQLQLPPHHHVHAIFWVSWIS